MLTKKRHNKQQDTNTDNANNMPIPTNSCHHEQGSSFRRSGPQPDSLVSLAAPVLPVYDTLPFFPFSETTRTPASSAEQRRFLSAILTAAIAIADEASMLIDDEEELPEGEDSTDKPQ